MPVLPPNHPAVLPTEAYSLLKVLGPAEPAQAWPTYITVDAIAGGAAGQRRLRDAPVAETVRAASQRGRALSI